MGILVSFQGEEALLILFCFSGWINDFLCWGGFVPLSRISYIIYLMHFTVIWTFESVMIYPLDGTNLMMVILLHTGAKFHLCPKIQYCLLSQISIFLGKIEFSKKNIIFATVCYGPNLTLYFPDNFLSCGAILHNCGIGCHLRLLRNAMVGFRKIIICCYSGKRTRKKDEINYKWSKNH